MSSTAECWFKMTIPTMCVACPMMCRRSIWGTTAAAERTLMQSMPIVSLEQILEWTILATPVGALWRESENKEALMQCQWEKLKYQTPGVNPPAERVSRWSGYTFGTCKGPFAVKVPIHAILHIPVYILTAVSFGHVKTNMIETTVLEKQPFLA